MFEIRRNTFRPPLPIPVHLLVRSNSTAPLYSLAYVCTREEGRREERDERKEGKGKGQRPNLLPRMSNKRSSFSCFRSGEERGWKREKGEGEEEKRNVDSCHYEESDSGSSFFPSRLDDGRVG